MISVPYHSSIERIDGASIMMRSLDVSAYNVGDTIRLTCSPDMPPRYGSLGITAINRESRTLHCDALVRSAIIAACDSDHVAIETSDTLTDDHAALVAYLLSAVRRKDWHAVSDAANDLRVLEASRQ